MSLEFYQLWYKMLNNVDTFFLLFRIIWTLHMTLILLIKNLQAMSTWTHWSQQLRQSTIMKRLVYSNLWPYGISLVITIIPVWGYFSPLDGFLHFCMKKVFFKCWKYVVIHLNKGRHVMNKEVNNKLIHLNKQNLYE